MMEIPQVTYSAPIAAAAVRSLYDLSGPAGRLEALYAPGRTDAPYAAVVCHPHPLFGGTMHNKVVYHAAKAFQHFGLPVLRFNFRGTGASQGVHDRGEGEQQDLLAAMEWLRREAELPLLVAGFSFGAWVALRTCCGDPATIHPQSQTVRGLVALGLPIQAGDRGYSYEFLDHCSLPTLFVSGAADEFGPMADVLAAFTRAPAPSEMVFVPGADHFFQPAAATLEVAPGAAQSALSGLAQMQAAIRAWLEGSFLTPPHFSRQQTSHSDGPR